MPLKVRRFCTSVFTITISAAIAAHAQTAQPSPSQTQAQPAVTQPTATPSIAKAPTSADVMRDRIAKAKAYIAVRNYSAAVYELENIRRETADPSVNAVATVLLMNGYIEQGDYKRAQDFLNEFYRSYKSNTTPGALYYSAIAAQVVKGARNQVERYRALGLMVSDRNLPLEAVNDIERMRELVELVITQAKEVGGDKAKGQAAMAILEEATASRSLLARDDYDARRWRDEAADSREQIANSRSVIVNAVDGTAVPQPQVMQQTVAANVPAATSGNPSKPVYVPNPPAATNPQANAPVFKPVAAEQKPAGTTAATTQNPAVETPKQTQTAKQVEPPKSERPREIAAQPETRPALPEPKKDVQTASASEPKGSGPMDVGSLITYALKQQAPVYPPAARNMRATGVVRVDVTVNEDGEVAEVQKTTGPTLLQTAAKDAIRRWKFKPFTRDGQPVKASGFVNFNFSL